MKSLLRTARIVFLSALALNCLTAAAQTQNVSFIDPGLEAAIRDALQKTNGPLTTTDLLNLTDLEAENRGITNVQGLEFARNLNSLDLENNKLTNFALPNTLTNLTFLDLNFNELAGFSLPGGLSNLDTLLLSGNQLTNIHLPGGLTALNDLDLDDNGLSSVLLPQDVTNLTFFFALGNPLTAVVVSEPIAAGNLADAVASLKAQNVPVDTFPLTTQLVSSQQTAAGQFEFVLTGPPGVYAIQASSNLVAWAALGAITNTIGAARFVDVDTNAAPSRFYRAQLAQ